MKSIQQLSLLVLLIFSFSTAGECYTTTTITTNTNPVPLVDETTKKEVFKGLHIDSAQDILDLSPKKIRKATGKRLSIKEIITLKLVQRKVRKQMNGESDDLFGGDKDQLIALLLCGLIGVLGIHRFYLGYTTIGIIQLLTLGGCGIWALIDLVRIITGDLKPKDSSYDKTIQDY